MAKKTAKKQPNKESDKKVQAKAAKAAFNALEEMLLEKLSEEEFCEYVTLAGKMSPQQKMFCLFYADCGNGAEAARKAGYSAKSARKQANKLRTKGDIRKFLDFLRVAFESDEIAKIPEIMKMYTRILRREEKEYVPITVKEHKSYFDKSGKRKIVDKERVEIIEIPTKISDVNHAADSMMKRWGAFKESVTVNSKIEVEENDISTLAKTMTIAEMEEILRNSAAKMGEESEHEQS